MQVFDDVDAAGPNVREQHLEADDDLVRVVATVVDHNVERADPLRQRIERLPVGLVQPVVVTPGRVVHQISVKSKKECSFVATDRSRERERQI